MNVNVTYDTNTLTTAPSDFFIAVNYVVSLFDTTFTNNASINIEVGYGDFPYDGTQLTSYLGESQQNNIVSASYSQVTQALVNDSASGASTLPSSSPISGRLQVGSAQEKALGLIGTNGTLDGWVGIASDAELQQLDGNSWSFSATATPAANQYYLVGVIDHEFTEVMGRDSYLDTRGEYGVLDLYRYAAPGVRRTGTGDPAYFSIDNGSTNLDSFNDPRVAAGDLGDWASSAGPGGFFQSAGADAFLNNTTPGQINGLTSTDLTEMAALGWDAPPDNTPPSEPQSTLPVSIGGTATISHDFLWSYDPDNTAAELSYTVDTAPTHGTILVNGSAASSFTQADIDNGIVQYRENGDAAVGDAFTFTVSDPAGNRIGPEPYTISIVNSTAPVVDVNASLSVSIGSSAMIWTDSLCIVALGNDPAELTYSVVAAPPHGTLLVNGASANSFTQADIDDKRVQYRENGDGVSSDAFGFQVTDAAGDETPVTIFNIAISDGVQGPGAEAMPLFNLSNPSFGANATLGYSANGDNAGGALPVSDGMHTASLALVGQYAAAGFATASDQGGGTIVTDTPAQGGGSDPNLLTNPQH